MEFIIFLPLVARSKFYSGRNEEQIEVRECLLLFGAESFVLQVAILKNLKIKIYIIIFCLWFCLSVKPGR